MSTHGHDVHMVYQFPQGTPISDLNALFNKPGVLSYSVKVAPTGAVGTRTRGATGGQVYVETIIHHPQPVNHIESEIRHIFGRFGINVKKVNLTDYHRELNKIGTIDKLTFKSSVKSSVNDLARLFGNVRMGGKRRKARKTRKINKRRH